LKLFSAIISTNSLKGVIRLKNKESTLIQKAIKGNQAAFAELVKMHYEQIYRTAFLYVHNQEDALDIVQESTYQALISIHGLKNPEYFMTWFTKIVIRCSGQLLSRRKNDIPLTENILASLTAESDNINEDSLSILEALGKLKESYRTTLILFYYHDYSIKTISGVMEIPEGTVKTYLSRGKDELKKRLEGKSSYED
jgi:RNA polymerase sigma-70 factor (TIGR02954 family)